MRFLIVIYLTLNLAFWSLISVFIIQSYLTKPISLNYVQLDIDKCYQYTDSEVIFRVKSKMDDVTYKVVTYTGGLYIIQSEVIVAEKTFEYLSPVECP